MVVVLVLFCSFVQTGQTVAIKKIRLGKQKEGINFTALREIKLLKELKDPNIIELIDAFPHKGNLHLVFEFMETDLEAVIRDRNIFLSPADIKSYLQMTLKGLAYCHKKWVLHRYAIVVSESLFFLSFFLSNLLLFFCFNLSQVYVLCFAGTSSPTIC